MVRIDCSASPLDMVGERGVDGVKPVGNVPPRPSGSALAHVVPDGTQEPLEEIPRRSRFQNLVDLVGWILEPRLEQGL
eukprot:4961965-Pyramimonas_sp.AAC.1